MKGQLTSLSLCLWCFLLFTTVSFPLRADVLLDDLFDDGSRTNPALPDSGGWLYSSGASACLVVTNSTLQWTTTASSIVLGYFTSKTLATGESITLKVTFSVKGTITGVQNGLRVALFNSAGSRVSTDAFGVTNSLFQGYSGYGVYTDLGNATATGSQLFRRDAGTATASYNLMGGGYPTCIGPKASGAQVAAGQNYSALLSIRNNGTTCTTIFTLNGVVLSMTDAVNYKTFDTVALNVVAGMVNAVTISELSVITATESAFPPATSSTTPVAVPTYESMGLYWSPAGGDSATACQVNYRLVGATDWSCAQPLVYDVRNGEYRGSIVSLKSNSSYEIKTTLATGTTSTITARTWNSTFPIGSTVTFSAGVTSTSYTISTGGSASGYALYVGAADGSTVIDVNNLAVYGVRIRASYVILRNVTVKGAIQDGVLISGAVHDVVIENNDISGWGRIDTDGWGMIWDSGVRADTADVYRLTIQRNKIHDPRSNSNDWTQPRGAACNPHPNGPQGITLVNSTGNNVIRFNEIYADESHRFNDGMGGYYNFSYYGFPGRDSDVYGNIVRNVCDDALEIEGGSCNVRVWNNYMDLTYTGIASASCSVGPLYIYRNVLASCRESASVAEQGIFDKSGDTGLYGMGQRYLFHNTLLQPLSGSTTLGAKCSITSSWTGPLTHTTSLNNIWHVTTGMSLSSSVTDATNSPTNRFDYDLCNSTVTVPSTQETHKVVGVPIYLSGNGPLDGSGGHYALSSNSPGYDQGVVLANFNDGYTGTAPDMGAHESATQALQFGVNATQN